MDPNFHFVQAGYNRFLIDKRYTNLKPCGDGSYGFVASADDAVTGGKVAIKKIKDAFSDSVDAKRILRELKLLRHFNSHENIISILDIMTVPPNTPNFSDIYIVTNLMESDLERIVRSRQVLTDQHFQYFLYQILRALKYVHSANVLHRDLKPSNLLVNANCDLAICDFGLARGFYIEGQDTLTEYVVTRW
jgi:mitogen-activated protein kinase 1/3